MLTIIRGLPGSGKSILAYRLRTDSGMDWFEADKWMVDENGKYKFDPAKLKDCHRQCQDSTRQSLAVGRDVIVSNTFTQRWEYQSYLDMAKEFNTPVQVIEVHGYFGSVHNVPDDVHSRMKARWEPHV
jgi:predicted kinase